MKKNNKIFISFFFALFGIFPNFIVLNSCKKASSFSIKYGDEINCLDQKKDKFISIKNLKNLIKGNFVVSPPREFTNNEFNDLAKQTVLKKSANNHAFIEEMYYEIIMSLIEYENKGFQLKWDCIDKHIFNYVEIATTANEKNIFISIQYIKKGKNIYLNLITENGIEKAIKSYKFKHCLVK